MYIKWKSTKKGVDMNEYHEILKDASELNSFLNWADSPDYDGCVKSEIIFAMCVSVTGDKKAKEVVLDLIHEGAKEQCNGYFSGLLASRFSVDSVSLSCVSVSIRSHIDNYFKAVNQN